MNDIPKNKQDGIAIRRRVAWFRTLRWFGAKKLLQAFVDRAFERDWIDSRGYHELHAAITRILLAILLVLTLTSCEPAHDPRAGKVQDAGPGGQFAGGNN